MYKPITASPGTTCEYPPSQFLRPYIRCYWGSDSGNSAAEGILIRDSQQAERETIIPDTCMDIIWELEKGKAEPRIYFCGINDAPFEVPSHPKSHGTIRFGIRFHFWAVHYFADNHMRDVLNSNSDVDVYFGSFRNELGGLLAQMNSMEERICAAESYLLRRLERSRYSSDSLMNAVYTLVRSKGVVSAAELQISSGLSSRQLERLFQEYIGLSPKKISDLVRFQNVWRDIYIHYQSESNLDIQDIIFDYRFSHQSHFINSFRKYAGRTPLVALAHARL
ncbi:helix-turn-helix domain-containing protein [Paenibacillus sp. sgz500958]|uniref:helix-turn-helix domain-containing protein n=1 Tax=Paenibacillus sp. sgz500958 TaxID=3242475 RepID=UPI0036D42823